MDEQLRQLAQTHRTNAYLVGLYDAIDEINNELALSQDTALIRCTHGAATHDYDPAAPEILNADGEVVLCGFVRVHHGDPHYPLWLYRERIGTRRYDTARLAVMFGVTERRMRAIAGHRHKLYGIGERMNGGWLFRPEELEHLRPDEKHRHK